MTAVQCVFTRYTHLGNQYSDQYAEPCQSPSFSLLVTAPPPKGHHCPHFRQPRLVLPVCVLKIKGVAGCYFKVVSKAILKLFPE